MYLMRHQHDGVCTFGTEPTEYRPLSWWGELHPVAKMIFVCDRVPGQFLHVDADDETVDIAITNGVEAAQFWLSSHDIDQLCNWLSKIKERRSNGTSDRSKVERH